MLEFMNYGESILTLVVFIIALYLNKGSKKKSYVLIIITGLMFLYTLFGMPFTQKNKAAENVVLYKDGSTLSCSSGFLVFSSTLAVNEKTWDLEGNYFINKQNKETIRTDKCTK